MQELQDQRRNFVELIGEIGHFRRQMTAECHHGDPFFFSSFGPSDPFPSEADKMD